MDARLPTFRVERASERAPQPNAWWRHAQDVARDCANRTTDTTEALIDQRLHHIFDVERRANLNQDAWRDTALLTTLRVPPTPCPAPRAPVPVPTNGVRWAALMEPPQARVRILDTAGEILCRGVTLHIAAGAVGHCLILDHVPDEDDGVRGAPPPPPHDAFSERRGDIVCLYSTHTWLLVIITNVVTATPGRSGAVRPHAVCADIMRGQEAPVLLIRGPCGTLSLPDTLWASLAWLEGDAMSSAEVVPPLAVAVPAFAVTGALGGLLTLPGPGTTTRSFALAFARRRRLAWGTHETRAALFGCSGARLVEAAADVMEVDAGVDALPETTSAWASPSPPRASPSPSSGRDLRASASASVGASPSTSRSPVTYAKFTRYMHSPNVSSVERSALLVEHMGADFDTRGSFLASMAGDAPPPLFLPELVFSATAESDTWAPTWQRTPADPPQPINVFQSRAPGNPGITLVANMWYIFRLERAARMADLRFTGRRLFTCTGLPDGWVLTAAGLSDDTRLRLFDALGRRATRDFLAILGAALEIDTSAASAAPDDDGKAPVLAIKVRLPPLVEGARVVLPLRQEAMRTLMKKRETPPHS